MSEDIQQNGTTGNEPDPGIEGTQPASESGQQGQQMPPTGGYQYAAPPPPPPPPPPYMPPYQQYTPPPTGQRRGRWIIPTALAVGCLPWLILFTIAVTGAMGIATSGAGTGLGGDHIALIRVNGVITAGKSGSSMFGDSSTGSEDLIKQLEKARKDDSAKAILIRINSPGGSAAGSEEVYNEIRRITKKGHKPVYASMGDVAASGGYYIASACDKIYADGGTLTGSIGVIFETNDMSALFKKIGFSPQVIKSGKFKDIGSPNRAMTPDEKQLLQGMINDIYARFVNAVSEGRDMPVAEVKKIADGRIFTGSQAVKVKLVDELGGMREATLAAARAGGIEGEPDVEEYTRHGVLDALFGSTEEASSQIDKAATREMVNQLLRNRLPVR